MTTRRNPPSKLKIIHSVGYACANPPYALGNYSEKAWLESSNSYTIRKNKIIEFLMKAKDLVEAGELKHKMRTVKDLVSYISYITFISHFAHVQLSRLEHSFWLHSCRFIL